MENQGYVEDQSRIAEEQSTLELRDEQLRVETIDVIDDPVVTAATTPSEGHVYEDIATFAGIDACELPEQTSCPDESRDPRETKNRRSIDFAIQAWINGPPCPVIDRLFQQSSALSSARIGTNHNSSTTSSREASKTSEDDPERFFGKSRYLPTLPPSGDISENVSSSPRTNEDSSRNASVTTQSDRRPNRRRRKKDCKHCRSKLADAGSCEKLDELVNNKDAILRENGDNHRDKNPDASTLLFREPLLRTQNIKIYPLVRKTSLRDIDAKRNSSAAFPASEYGVHKTENTAKLLLSTEDRMLGQVVENAQGGENKILGVMGKGTDMRINSIYSQDRWYLKEPQIFYTDVKDQNPFQVSCAVCASVESYLLFLSFFFLKYLIFLK